MEHLATEIDRYRDNYKYQADINTQLLARNPSLSRDLTL